MFYAVGRFFVVYGSSCTPAHTDQAQIRTTTHAYVNGTVYICSRTLARLVWDEARHTLMLNETVVIQNVRMYM